MVQAGPGLPMMHEAEVFERVLGLESHFRVVYWDQRGTGRSSAGMQPLTVDLLVDDLVAVANALCSLLGVEFVDVVGFSLGGTLALLAGARAAAPIRRVVAVGPDIDFPESERFAWEFARQKAKGQGHQRALRQLDALGPPPHDTPQRFMTGVKWVTHFGGIMGGASFLGLFLQTVWRLLRSPAYSVFEAIGALFALQRTQAHLLKTLGDFSLPERLARVDVPITIVQGRHDAAAPPELAASFVNGLAAPNGKRLVWFERSAHMPHFEEPEAFRRVLLETLG